MSFGDGITEKPKTLDEVIKDMPDDKSKQVYVTTYVVELSYQPPHIRDRLDTAGPKIILLVGDSSSEGPRAIPVVVKSQEEGENYGKVTDYSLLALYLEHAQKQHMPIEIRGTASKPTFSSRELWGLPLKIIADAIYFPSLEVVYSERKE